MKSANYEKMTTIRTIKRDEYTVCINIGESVANIIQTLKEIPPDVKVVTLVDDDKLNGHGDIIFRKEKLIKSVMEKRKGE